MLIDKKLSDNEKENLFIESNPEMVKRLNESINQLINNQVIEMTLEELKVFEK